MRVEEQIDEKPLDRGAVMLDLVIAAGPRRRRMFQPVQRALARQRLGRRRASVESAEQHAEDGVAPQLVVVDQIFIAKRQAEHALRDQRRQRMQDIQRIAEILEAGGETFDQPDGLVRLAEQESPGVRGNHPAVEIRHYAAAAGPSKIHLARATLRLHRGAPRIGVTYSRKTSLYRQRPRCASVR